MPIEWYRTHNEADLREEYFILKNLDDNSPMPFIDQDGEAMLGAWESFEMAEEFMERCENKDVGIGYDELYISKEPTKNIASMCDNIMYLHKNKPPGKNVFKRLVNKMFRKI